MFHSCWKDSDGCSYSKYDGVNYSAKVVKKSHMRKEDAIFFVQSVEAGDICPDRQQSEIGEEKEVKCDFL